MKESHLIFGLMISFKKNEYSFADILWLTAPFQVSEASLRTNLSRMVANNILDKRREGKNALYSLSGRSTQLGSNVAMAFNSSDWSAWNNIWWGISLSIPENEKKQRYLIHKKLLNHRFAALHPGFWIRPFNEAEKVNMLLRGIIENKYAKTIVFNFHSDQEMLSIPELWHVGEINQQYKSCINYITHCYREYNLENPREALVGKMTIGDIVVKQLAKDPLLPEIFLPSDWQGTTLRTVFREWDKLTTEKSKPYWEKIFTNQKFDSIINQKHNGQSIEVAL